MTNVMIVLIIKVLLLSSHVFQLISTISKTPGGMIPPQTASLSETGQPPMVHQALQQPTGGALFSCHTY